MKIFQALYDSILRAVFSRIPIINLLDGYKTKIGALLKFASALIILVKTSFPDQFPILDQVNGWIVLVTGILVEETGKSHQAVKKRSGGPLF